ncbi:MAG: DedA family protein [Parcubacteria group bacterium]|nr:DedA family protein [Parcubacteria group bacterium]
MLNFIDFFLQISQNMGYAGVVFLMAIESSFIPMPSEIIIIPAAYLAQQGEMNIFLVIISGIVGSLIGAIFNYFLAYYLGRAIIYKLADCRLCKILLISSKKIKKSEEFFLKYGNISTLLGRLVPVVRQLISLPAGFSKMNFKNFVLFTFLGSTIWITVLAILGYAFGSNQELLLKYYKEISLFFVILVLFACAIPLSGTVVAFFRRKK